MKIPGKIGNHTLPSTHRRSRRPAGPIVAGIAGTAAAGIFAFRKIRHPSAANSPGPETGDATLRRHVADMIAVDREMLEAFRSQLTGGLIENVPHARDIVVKACETFEQQAGRFDAELAQLGGAPAKTLKEHVGIALGKAVPMIQRSRTESLARAVRDDIVALHLVSVSAGMLSTTARALDHERIADSAKEGAETFARLAAELHEAVPMVALRELLHKNLPGAQALENAVNEQVQTWQEADNPATARRHNGVAAT